MNKKLKLLSVILFAVILSVALLACTSDNDIDYNNIEDITVDEASIADSFLRSEFDISKVLLNVKLFGTVDATGSAVDGEVIQIPVTMNMVKAEDKAKLSVAGTHTITVIYRRFELTFTITLIDSVQQIFRVTFLDEDGNRLGDVQNVVAGDRAIQPSLPSKLGYSFIGWRDRDTGAMTTFDNISKDTTLEAVYAPNNYKVGFYTKIDGREELISEVNVPRGANALDYAPNIPIKVGYSNGEWENTEAMKNVSSEGLKFFAVYDADTVSVTFKYMRFGATLSSHVISYKVGSEIKNPPEASMDGYKFLEWRVNGKKVEFPYTVTTEIIFEAIYINLTVGTEGLGYEITEGGLAVSSYNGDADVIVIPEEAKRKGSDEILPVVGIHDNVFKDKNIKEFVVSNDNMYFVTIDNVLFNKNVTVLYAYPSAKSDMTYILPETVTEVMPNAFYGANNLGIITLNDKLITIGDYAFAECENLSGLKIPRLLQKIGEGAFSNKQGGAIGSISFEDAISLKSIGDKAFYGAITLTEVALPSTLEELGAEVFGGCKSLSSITAINNSNFVTVNGGLYSRNRRTLYCYPAMYGINLGSVTPEITIDSACTRILSGAIEYAKVSSIIIYSDVTLDFGAINCPTLRRVFFDGTNITLDEGCFGSFVPEIILNAQNISAKSREEITSTFGEKVSLYDSETWQQVRDFQNNFIFETYTYTDAINGLCTGIRILGTRQMLPGLVIPSTIGSISVTAIADYAFYGDNYIEKLYLPSDLREIGEKAFAYMNKLVEVTINDIVLQVGDYAFAHSKKLANVFCSAELMKMEDFGKGVFEGTAFAEKNDEFLIVGKVLVGYNGHNTTVVLPEEVDYIASDVFVRHGEITSITFGSGIRIIDERAFQNCDGIQQLYFPSTIEAIKKEAFYNCSNLFSIGFASTIAKAPYIDAEAFCGLKYEEPVIYFMDSKQYTLTYHIDNSDTFQEKGLAIVSAHSVDNTARIRFAGWYEDPEYTVLSTFPMKLTEDKTVYAKWINISESSSGIIYELTANGTYAVAGYEGSDTYVIVPSTYMGKAVKEIKAGAFKGKNVQKIELPNTRNYDGSVSSDLTAIGEDAFDGTPWFNNYSGDFVIIDGFLIAYKGRANIVYIPNSVTKIAQGAFKENGYIQKVVISENVTELVDEVFYGCAILEEVVLSEKMLSIGKGVFKNCGMLSKINFSDSPNLGSVGYDAFEGTPWYDNCTDPCVMINNILYKYNDNGEATVLHIYNGVISIGERAFEGNKTLRRVYIPQSVTTIGESAFAFSNVVEINLYAGGSNLTLIQAYAFYEATSLAVLDLSLASKLGYIGEYAFYNCGMLKKIEIPAETINIGGHAFEESGINTVTFHSGSKLTEIEEYTFSNCTSLNKVDFIGTNALTTIGIHAFEGCTSLTYFSNKDGRIYSIKDYAFNGCLALSKLYINENTLAEIGEMALASVGSTIGEKGFVVLGNILIGYEGYETEIVIPDNITTIYNGAFADNTRIKKVVFGANSAIININSNAFNGCTNLTEINFPSTIKFVGDNVVDGTKWYQKQIDDEVEFIMIANTLIKYNGNEAKQVIIPDYVQVINKGAFEDKAVFDITIGESVKTLQEGAFDGIDVNTFADWTITILGATPPVIKETELLNAKYILIQEREGVSEEELRDVYRLDTGWFVQYELIKIANKYTVVYNVDPEQGQPIANEDLYAIYGEKQVETNTDGERSYIFVGWYLDAEFTTSVVYPFILTTDVEIYARCYNNETGSNGADFRIATDSQGEKTLDAYLGTEDNKIVIISTQSDEYIKSITSGNVYDDNHRERYKGAFEDHSELNEVYFAIGSQIAVIGQNAFKNCKNLTKIVLPASIKRIETGAFEGCTSLKEIIFTGSCEGLVIQTSAFKNCTALERITLPEGIVGLGDKAFEGCSRLKNIYVLAEIAVVIGEALPFDLPVDTSETLRIHIKNTNGVLSSYSAIWQAYEAYLVADITTSEEE